MKRFLKFIAYCVSFVGLATFSLWAVSALLEPEPVVSDHSSQGAVVRVYGADVWGMRGHFAIHTWVATKTADERNFTIAQVIGWRLRRHGTALSVTTGNPNRPWFDSPPILLHEITGEEAEALVPKVRDAVRTYPYARTYTMWPGPNSNSFTQWIALQVPELGLDLPVKAIGQSWMTENAAAVPVAD